MTPEEEAALVAHLGFIKLRLDLVTNFFIEVFTKAGVENVAEALEADWQVAWAKHLEDLKTEAVKPKLVVPGGS